MQTNTVTIPDVLVDDSKDLKNIFTSTLTPNENNDDNEIDMGNCNYLTETELQDYLVKNRISDQTHLKLLSINVANLISKLKSLKLMIQNISNNSNRPNIITVTETHLSKFQNHGYSTHELEKLVPGYTFFHKDRNKKRGGGVGIFIEDTLAENAMVENDQFFIEEIFESLSIKIPNFPTETGKKTLIVTSIYRQPNDGHLQRFLDLLETWFLAYDKRSTNLIITGDLNLDLLKYQSHRITAEYLDLMISHNLLPVITRPTRIKHTSATLIDHIFLQTEGLDSFILTTELAGSHGYTDHYPVMCLLPINRITVTKPMTFTKKYFTSDGHKARREGLRRENWNDMYSMEDPNEAYQLLHDKYCKHYFNCLTTKTCTINKRSPKEPWMTKEILKKMKKRDRLSKLSNRRKDYKCLRNEIVSDCRKAEKKYWSSKIQNNMSDIKEHWQILKRIMGQVHDKTSLPNAFRNGNHWITDPKANADAINKYYANVGPETNKSVGQSTRNASHFLHKHSKRNPHSIEVEKLTEDDVLTACQKLNKKKSCDAYGLSQGVVLRDADILAPQIAHVVNCTLEKGIFPDMTKLARILPIYKEKGDRHEYGNYRPVSLLPVFSKILEKLIHNKVFEFLVRYQILFKSQYGFRKGHNTTHATLDFLQTVEKALQQNEYAIGIFCDLSKAFDTLDHQLLLRKLEHYGIRGKMLQLLKSYLSDRKQFVDLEGTRSEQEPMLGKEAFLDHFFS